VAWHNQSKAGAELIMDISNVRRHLPEGFSWCSPTAYFPSIIIELAELLSIQPAPADPVDSSRVATNLRQILRYLGPPAASCNFINTMRQGSPSYSIVMAFEDAFRTWEGKLMPHLSEWKPINTSSMFLRSAAQGHTFQSTIHSPAWMDLDGVHNWMWLHRPAATDDRACGNLEFLCTLTTPSPERMRYLLDLCKAKKTAHL